MPEEIIMPQKQTRGKPSIASVSERVDSLEDSTRTDLDGIRAELDSLRNEVSGIMDDVKGTVDEAIDDTADSLTIAIEEKGVELRSYVDSVSDGVRSDMSGEVMTVRSELKRFGDDMEMRLRTVDEVAPKVDNHTAEIAELRARMEEVFARITHAERTAASGLMDLGDSVDDLEDGLAHETEMNNRMNMASAVLSGLAAGTCIVVVCLSMAGLI